MSIKAIDLKDEGFKVAFLEGNFAIDCLEIKLTQIRTDDPQKYCSPGYILVSPENGAEMRLVIKRDHDVPHDIFANIRQASSVNSGELFPEHHFYKLEAHDVAGYIWTHPAVMLKVDSRKNVDILTFSCDHVDCEFSSVQSADFTHFIFPSDLNFPLNGMATSNDLVGGRERRSTRFTQSFGTLSGYQTSYYRCSSDKNGRAFEFIANAVEGKPSPDGFSDRLLEAIRFCSATMALPVMSDVSRNGQRVIRLAKTMPLNNGLISRPLLGDAYSLDFYRLMDCYYDYALLNASGDRGAPLSEKLGGIFTLKGVWLETIALLLCVTTESILNDPLYKPLGKPDGHLLDQINALFKWVKRAPLNKNLIMRATSAMGSMKSSRAVDRMHALVKVGAIDEEDISSWKFLRNASAHGSLKIEVDESQAMLDHVYRLISLIYKLVFVKIGYVGKFSNYGERGWSTRDFDASLSPEQLSIGVAAKKKSGLL